MDGKRFQNCTFENVTLIFHGSTDFSLEYNKFTGGLDFETDSGAITGAVMFFKAAGWLRQDIPIRNTTTPNSPVPLNPN